MEIVETPFDASQLIGIREDTRHKILEMKNYDSICNEMDQEGRDTPEEVIQLHKELRRTKSLLGESKLAADQLENKAKGVVEEVTSGDGDASWPYFFRFNDVEV